MASTDWLKPLSTGGGCTICGLGDGAFYSYDCYVVTRRGAKAGLGKLISCFYPEPLMFLARTWLRAWGS